MANSNNTIVYLLGAAGVFFGYKYYETHMTKKETSELKLKISDVHLTDQDTIMDIEVLNPNSQSMSIKSFIGDMLVNNVKVASINMFGDYVARGNLNVTVPLITKPYTAALMQQFRSAFGKGGIKISFAGQINVNDNLIPVTISYTR